MCGNKDHRPDPATARKTPCASCPYRADVPAGIWHADEYAKLPAYDGDIPEQSSAKTFFCHQTGREICAGWLGHRDHPTDLLAVRLGLANGDLDDSIADYSTGAELFGSGAEAAAHGISGIEDPDPRARQTISKILRLRRFTEAAGRS